MRVGFDVGGTFTDFVLQTDDGRLHTHKQLTTYPDPSEACLEGLDNLMRIANVDWSALEQAVHGTTLGSNLVIERKGSGVALVTTRGFRDVLVIGREKRYSLYDLQITKPEPLVDRSMVWEVDERMLADGSIDRPLDEEQARAVITDLSRKGVTSVAAAFLHSYKNAAHEKRFAEIAADVAPEIVVSLSSAISPEFREYERTSTTVVNAYLMGAVREYLRRMIDEISGRGYGGHLFIMQSSGGIATAESMTTYPVRMIESGPAAGALIAARFGEMAGYRDLVAFDMGGTTAKLSLITDGVPETVGQFELHKINLAPGSGIPMNVRSIDLVEIGAGGGSIAQPFAGTIQVGPLSASSVPGPVCYGLGGTKPTVTDANLVLGYLNPANFAGGTIKLDVDGARAAIAEQVATPLGMSVEDAAWGIHRIVNLNMELATRVVSIERGHDPRGLALVATGGSGPVHGCRLAQALGMPRAIMPAAAGVASAIGLLAAEVKFDLARSYVTLLDQADPSTLTTMFTELDARASEVVRDSTGKAPARLQREVELRYLGQGFELTVALPPGPLDDEAMTRVRAHFDTAYGQRYGFSSPDQAVEATTWKVTAFGSSPTIHLPRNEPSDGDAVTEVRPVYFPESGGYVDTKVYDRYRLAPGSRLSGPAIVEERESTTVIPPGMVATADEHANLLVEVS